MLPPQRRWSVFQCQVNGLPHTRVTSEGPLPSQAPVDPQRPLLQTLLLTGVAPKAGPSIFWKANSGIPGSLPTLAS